MLWSAPIGRPSEGLDFRKNEACLQFDAQFVIFEPGNQPGERNHVLWAADKTSQPVGSYFAAVGDDCSLCTWSGSPNGPGRAHPSFKDAIWCAFKGPCPRKITNPPPHPRRQFFRNNSDRSTAFPTSCSLASWQKRGMDALSVVADPMIVDAKNGNWQLNANSPALALGFIQLNVSAAGPRL